MSKFILFVFIILGYDRLTPAPNVSCTKPLYFNQAKWIEDSSGSEGYKNSIMKHIALDPSLIGAPRELITCIFLSESSGHTENGIEYLSYDWFYNGYTCAIVFKIRGNRVFEIRHFKGCG